MDSKCFPLYLELIRIELENRFGAPLSMESNYKLDLEFSNLYTDFELK